MSLKSVNHKQISQRLTKETSRDLVEVLFWNFILLFYFDFFFKIEKKKKKKGDKMKVSPKSASIWNIEA